jgi:hypothetical protein
MLNQLRVNDVRPPRSLAPRYLPRLDSTRLGQAALTFRALETVVKRPGPIKPRIVSSAHGALRHLLLCYPSYAGGEDVYRDVFADLFRQLPSTVELTILAHPSVVADLQSMLDTARPGESATIVEAPDYLHFSVWAEDPYVVVDDVGSESGQTFLVEPFTFPRYGDAAIADLVAEATPVQSTQSPLYFQGGNILTGDDFILIGVDYLLETWDTFVRYTPVVDLPTSQSEILPFVTNLFRKSFDPDRELLFAATRLQVPARREEPFTMNGEKWTQVLYAGTGTHQPVFHIDMFITLTGRSPSGRYRVLVGSPTEAARILGEPALDHAMGPIFDDVARQLVAQDFEVIRNPLPLTYVDDPDSRRRTWYFATSNNCLVQVDDRSGNHVWLPTYGHGPWADLRATDEANKQAWEQLGFTVHQLADFHVFAQSLGSVHCIKKYLAR